MFQVKSGRPLNGALQRFAGPVLAAVLAVLSTVAAGGCAETPELGSEPNTYTTYESAALLRIMEVDLGLSRQAQSGGLDPAGLPADRLVFEEVQADGSGGGAGVPWVVSADFFFTQYDIFYAESAPASDGTWEVTYQLNDTQGRDNSSKLQRLTASMAAAAGAAGETASLAVVYNDTVRAILPVATPIVDGEIRVTGLSAEEAEEMIFYFPDRAYRYPEEGKESKWSR